MGMILRHTSPTNGAITAHVQGERTGAAILFRVARPSNREMSPIVPMLFCEERRALAFVVNVQLIPPVPERLASQGECPWLDRKSGSRHSTRTPSPAIRGRPTGRGGAGLCVPGIRRLFLYIRAGAASERRHRGEWLTDDRRKNANAPRNGMRRALLADFGPTLGRLWADVEEFGSIRRPSGCSAVPAPGKDASGWCRSTHSTFPPLPDRDGLRWRPASRPCAGWG